MKRTSRILRILGRTAGLLLALALLAAALAVTPFGLRRLTPFLQARLAQGCGMPVVLEGVRLRWPLELSVDRFVASDAQGVRLAVEAATARVSLRELLHARLHLVKVSVGHVAFNGWPASAVSRRRAPLDPVALLARIQMDELTVERVRLGAPFVKAPVEGRVTGSIVGSAIDLQVALLAVGDRDYAAQGPVVSLKANLMAGRDGRYDLAIELAAQGQLPNVAAALQAYGIPAAMVGGLPVADGAGRDADALSVSARVAMNGLSFESLDVLGMDARLGGHAWRSKSPVRLTREGGRFVLAPSVQPVGAGRLTIEGVVDAATIDVRMRLEDLTMVPLAQAHALDPALRLEADLTLQGPLSQPDVRLRVTLDGLRPAERQRWNGDPVGMELTATVGKGRLCVAGGVSGLPGKPVTVAVDLPMQLSLRPLALRWPAGEPVSGALSIETDLAGLASLFVMDVYHRLAGGLVVQAQLRGTLGAPELAGTATVVDGRYEHELSGVKLRQVDVAIVADREQITIERLQATDGGSGRLEAGGSLRLRPREGFPFESTLKLKEFRLVKNDAADVVGAGRLTWRGTLRESLLAGRVEVGPVEVRIPERLPTVVTPLAVTEFRGPLAVTAAAPSLGKGPRPVRRHRMTLNVEALATERVFVRGRGLDSEWGGRLSIVGDARDPRVTGSLKVQRGRFVFFGKRLTITRGVILFDGAFPPDPGMDIEAQLPMHDMTAVMRASGKVRQPAIVLESQPPLPEDEILALMLFGRESSRMTPWQALTLAGAVRQLRGGGSALDLIGATRRRLGIDQLEVRSLEASEGATSISVGKYVSDRVYVELERGVTAEGGRASVEIELAHGLSLESETGTQADTGVGLVWTYDY